MTDIKTKATTALDEAKKAGADKAQVVIKESETREMTLEGKEFTLYRTLFDESVAVTVYKDQKQGTYTTNKTDESSVAAAIGAAMESAQAGNPDEAYDIAPNQGELCKVTGPLEPDEELLFRRINEFKDDTAREFKKINLFQLFAKHTVLHKVSANTNGTVADEKTGWYEIVVEFNGLDGETSTSLDSTYFVTASLDKPFMEMSDVRTRFANTEKLLAPEPMEGKFVGTLVLDPSMTEMAMNEVMVMTGDSLILDKTSVFLDKLDEKIADERITVRRETDDPRIVQASLLASGDFKAEPYSFIENGVLKNFCISYFTEKKTGFAHAPNEDGGTVMLPGDTPLSDIIAGIDKGLLCCGFSGGKPSANGEFSGVAKNSFLIEGGKVTKAVTETMISGNFAELLNNLVAISKETRADGTSVMPYAAFAGVTISGK